MSAGTLRPFDAGGAFGPPMAGDIGELRNVAVRGAGAMVFSSGFALVFQMVATVVLARLLSPSDFGVVAMVTTFSLLLLNFGLNGFTEVVLHWKEIDHVRASNLFWINLCVGVAITAGFAAAGTLLARFYGNPRVAAVAVGVSLSIFMTSTSVIHQALLKRAMRFSAVSLNDIISRAVSVTVSILLAYRGWGCWALVAGLVAQPFAQSVGSWTICRWLPGLPRRQADTGAMVWFAINIYGRFTVNYSTRNMDNLLVGWRFGSGPLGFYKKAYDLFLLAASQLVFPLSNVAVSALSRLNRTSDEYRQYLLSALGVMAFVGMGVGADLTVVGKDVIRLILGPGWDVAGRIFTFFGPGIGIMLLYATHGWIHLSIGTAERWFCWVMVEFTVTGLLFLLGLRWGPEGIAAAWTASFWILTIPAFWYAGKPIKLGIAPVLASVWKYLLASLFAGCVSGFILREITILDAGQDWIGAAIRIIVVSCVFGTLYLGAVIVLHGGSAPLHQFSKLLREMLPWGRIFNAKPPIAAMVGTGANAAD